MLLLQHVNFGKITSWVHAVKHTGVNYEPIHSPCPSCGLVQAGACIIPTTTLMLCSYAGQLMTAVACTLTYALWCAALTAFRVMTQFTPFRQV